MSQSFNESYVDVSDAGRGTDIFLTRGLSDPRLTCCAPLLDDNSQYAMPIQDLQGVPNFSSGSGQIFSMYLEMATEEDRKMAETWQVGADRILIFVGFHLLLIAYFTPTHQSIHRPVFAQLSSLHLSRCPFRTFDRTDRTLPIFTWRTSTRMLPTPIDPTFQAPSLFPHLPFLHQPTPSG